MSNEPSSSPHDDSTSAPWKDVPVDWEALEDAFENNAPEVHSYLHVSTGDVLRIVDGIADPMMHSRIASDTAYLRIEPVSSREQYRWMERFIPLVEEPPLQEKLTHAIEGKGAFRRFKDVLMSFASVRERWFAFRSERLRIFMEAWLSAHALNPTRRIPWTPEPEEAAPAANNDDAPHESQQKPARARSAEAMRRQLRELVESLGLRDLEMFATFGEFLRARLAGREARASQRSMDASTPSSPGEPDEGAPPASEAAEETPPAASAPSEPELPAPADTASPAWAKGARRKVAG